MAVLGLLSIVQIAILPGYLLARALRLRGGLLATLVLAFALSLVVNHALVAGLVLLGIYRPAVVYAIFAAETALFLFLPSPSGRGAGGEGIFTPRFGFRHSDFGFSIGG